MTPLEAIPAIETLLERLIHQSRDAKTLALVKQIETPYRVLQASYFKAEKEALQRQQELSDANRKIGQIETDHTKAMSALHGKYGEEISELNKQLDYWKTQAATKMDETLCAERHKQSESRKRRSLHND